MDLLDSISEEEVTIFSDPVGDMDPFQTVTGVLEPVNGNGD